MRAYPLLPLAYCLLPTFPASAQVAIRWDAEVTRPAQYDIPVMRGETVTLEPRLTAYARPLDLAGCSASLWIQTNGMGSAWWQVPGAALSETGRVSAAFGPTNDVGAASYTYFLGVVHTNSQRSYRAFGTLGMRASPGWSPAAAVAPAAYPGLAGDLWPYLLPYAAAATNPVPAWIAASSAAATNPVPGWIASATGGVTAASIGALTGETDALAIAALATNRADRLWASSNVWWTATGSNVWTMWKVAAVTSEYDTARILINVHAPVYSEEAGVTNLLVPTGEYAGFITPDGGGPNGFDLNDGQWRFQGQAGEYVRFSTPYPETYTEYGAGLPLVLSTPPAGLIGASSWATVSYYYDVTVVTNRTDCSFPTGNVWTAIGTAQGAADAAMEAADLAAGTANDAAGAAGNALQLIGGPGGLQETAAAHYGETNLHWREGERAAFAALTNSSAAAATVYTPIVAQTNVIRVGVAPAVYFVTATNSIAISNDLSQLTLNCTSNALWEIWYNATTTNALAPTWSSRVEWQGGSPDMTVTGLYRFALSTACGSRIRARQTWPTVFKPVEGYPIVKNGTTGNLQTRLAVLANATETNSFFTLSGPVGDRLYRIQIEGYYSSGANTSVNPVMALSAYTFFNAVTITTNFPTVSVPANTAGFRVSTYLPTVTTAYFDPLTIKVFVNTSVTGAVSTVYVNKAYIREFNELEISAYAAGWRP